MCKLMKAVITNLRFGQRNILMVVTFDQEEPGISNNVFELAGLI